MITRFRLLVLLLVLIMILSGCGNNQSASPDGSSSQQQSINILINTGLFTVSYEFSQEDTDSSWDKNSATMISLNENTARISGSGASFSSGVLTIKQAGTYVLSGTLKDGQVLIDAGKNDIVRIVLNGVALHNEKGSAIYAEKAKKVVLILEKGTQNAVSDGSNYTATGEDDPNAAVYVKNDLSITGDGTLTVTGSFKHGIRTQDILAITGGTINVKAAGDALRGRDGIAVQNGSFNLQAGSDGIQSNNATDDSKGFVVITGGTFDIQSGNDAVQAQSALTVAGGSFTIKTGSGSANAPARAEERPGGGMGGGRGGWGGEQQQTPQEEENESKKALKAGKLVNITGGDFTIDAEDDAVHSNDNITVTSGKFTVKTGDDGFHADNAIEISGGDINISVCYEGIEGLSVTISGGNISIVASDDAINASSGESTGGGQMGRPQGGGMQGGNGGEPKFAVTEGAFIRITGGTLDLKGGTDGIDSNGHIYFEGGTVKISGQSSGAEGALEQEGDFVVTGGELITAGSVYTPAASSTQPVILLSYTSQQASGSVVTIKDSSGKVLIEYTSKMAFSASGFTSPSFKKGEKYTVFINGEKRIEITISDLVTKISDDGGTYSIGRGGGMGGGRGDWGGGPPGRR